MVSASDLGPEGREFEPRPVHPRCVLRQNTWLSQCLSPPRCINGKLLWGPDKMLRGNLRWTSIPSRGSRNTPSRFILQKLEISAGTDEPSGAPNYDWGRLYLLPTRLSIAHLNCKRREIKRSLRTSMLISTRLPLKTKGNGGQPHTRGLVHEIKAKI